MELHAIAWKYISCVRTCCRHVEVVRHFGECRLSILFKCGGKSAGLAFLMPCAVHLLSTCVKIIAYFAIKTFGLPLRVAVFHALGTKQGTGPHNEEYSRFASSLWQLILK